MNRVSGRRRPAAFAEADAGLLAVLGDLEGAVNYTEWILDSFGDALRHPLIEVGAGQGTYTARLAENGPVTALEPSEAQSEVLRDRVGDRAGIDVVCGGLESVEHANDAYASAVLINVLEHIEDDDDALRRLFALLSPGGALCLWVPAFEFLYGPFDNEIGHYRRYRLRDLRAKVERHGFHVERARYANLPGWFAWLLIVRLLRRRPTAGALAEIYDRRLVPLIRRVERVVRPPFGQSVLLVARRP
jgi:SAM-dependent methyltransferase